MQRNPLKTMLILAEPSSQLRRANYRCVGYNRTVTEISHLWYYPSVLNSILNFWNGISGGIFVWDFMRRYLTIATPSNLEIFPFDHRCPAAMRMHLLTVGTSFNDAVFPNVIFDVGPTSRPLGRSRPASRPRDGPIAATRFQHDAVVALPPIACGAFAIYVMHRSP